MTWSIEAVSATASVIAHSVLLPRYPSIAATGRSARVVGVSGVSGRRVAAAHVALSSSGRLLHFSRCRVASMA